LPTTLAKLESISATTLTRQFLPVLTTRLATAYLRQLETLLRSYRFAVIQLEGLR